LGFASISHAAESITVSSKIDTEGSLLGNLIAVSLTRHGLSVVDKIQLGPTRIVRGAILAGQIDIYPEYTGNGAFFFHLESDPLWRDAAAAAAKVKELDAANHLVWLAASPADNTWGIAIRKDFAQANRLVSLDDFAAYLKAGGKVKLAASVEFTDSSAALPAFEAAYGFKFSQSQLLVLAGGDTAATIRAAAEGTDGVNAAMAYGTDGALAALGLVLLTDDRHAQIVYQPAPVVRAEVLERHPEIAGILDPVFRSLTLETLQELNARIAVDGEDAKAVAADYLTSKGFTQ
jgi:osmoprotectant transport system substrate-binding protein